MEFEIKGSLAPRIQAYTEGLDVSAKQSAIRVCSSFAQRVQTCHPYSHRQNEENVVAPPVDLAIILIAAGADFIRWIVSLPIRR